MSALNELRDLEKRLAAEIASEKNLDRRAGLIRSRKSLCGAIKHYPVQIPTPINQD